VISPILRRNLKFVAAMTVGARRHMGLDEAAIRRESLAVASRAVAENIADLIEQESLIVTMEREIDRAIEESRGVPE
jgi:hypothetical protein